MQPIRNWQFYLYIFLIAVVFHFCLRGDRWFPLLDSANLAFHEFGHPFFGLFSNRLTVYGGTLGQLIFPVAVTLRSLIHADTLQLSIGVLWIAQNFFNIARYMADARAQQLPLVGGGDHDWAEIFNRWNCLESDVKISNHLIKLVVLALIVYVFWLYQQIEEN